MFTLFGALNSKPLPCTPCWIDNCEELWVGLHNLKCSSRVGRESEPAVKTYLKIEQIDPLHSVTKIQCYTNSKYKSNSSKTLIGGGLPRANQLFKKPACKPCKPPKFRMSIILDFLYLSSEKKNGHQQCCNRKRQDRIQPFCRVDVNPPTSRRGQFPC